MQNTPSTFSEEAFLHLPTQALQRLLVSSAGQNCGKSVMCLITWGRTRAVWSPGLADFPVLDSHLAVVLFPKWAVRERSHAVFISNGEHAVIWLQRDLQMKSFIN